MLLCRGRSLRRIVRLRSLGAQVALAILAPLPSRRPVTAASHPHLHARWYETERKFCRTVELPGRADFILTAAMLSATGHRHMHRATGKHTGSCGQLHRLPFLFLDATAISNGGWGFDGAVRGASRKTRSQDGESVLSAERPEPHDAAQGASPRTAPSNPQPS